LKVFDYKILLGSSGFLS